MHTIRWILVIPAAIASWFITIVLGGVILSVGDRLCPPELIISGRCIASWYPVFFQSAFVFCVALSAVFAIFSGAYMAPTHRPLVAKIIFISGAAFAIFFAVGTKEYIALVSALLCGLGSMLFIIKQGGVSNAA